jgi:hypothetical protein
MFYSICPISSYDFHMLSYIFSIVRLDFPMEPSNFSGAPSIDVLQAAMPLAQDHAIVIATSSASAWLKGKSDSGNHGFPMKLSLKPIQ